MNNIFKKLDHLGYACHDIQSTIPALEKDYAIESISEIVFDAYQNANLCYITVKSGPNIELVCGPAVKNILNKGLTLYHTCYEVENIDLAIEQIKKNGGLLVKAPYAAPLFNNRKVAFLETSLGLIEVLETRASANQEQAAAKLCLAASFSSQEVVKSLAKISENLSWPLQVQTAEYNQVLQTLLDPSSIFYQNPNGPNLILLRVRDWFRYVDLNAESTEQLNEFIAAIEVASRANIKITLAFFPSDAPAKLATFVADAEQKIIAAVGNKVTVWQGFLSDFTGEIYDAHTDKISSIPYTETANQALSLELLRRLHLQTRRPYKVLVVDCDNTLWQGVCGEDGVAGIHFNQANLLLQQKLHALSKQGVLICLASKNAEKDVLEVFAKRAEMPLKLEDVIHYKINWEAKSKNILEIAETLNLNLDDFVFIDDNPIEIAEVSNALPQVLCLQIPNDTQQAISFLQNSWYFDIGITSNFDTERSQFYKTNVQREELKQQTRSFSDFIQQLQIQPTVAEIEPADYARIAQLLQRTTQFNLSNIKYTEHDLDRLMQQSGSKAYKLHVQDRFGDYGLVGAIILELTDDAAVISNFVFSCRTLGKGIEHMFLSAVAAQAIAQNKFKLIAKFNNSSKNQPALNFLNSLPILTSYAKDQYQIYEFACEALLNIEYKPHHSATTYNASNTSKNSVRLHDNQVIANVLSTKIWQANLSNTLLPVNDSSKGSTVTATLENVQNALQEIWQQVLAVPVSNQDSFFALGGDSLLAVRVLSRIKQALGAEVDLDVFFAKSCIQELASHIVESALVSNAANDQISPITPAANKELGFTQEWLWVLDQYDQGNSWYYNMPHAMRIQGELNIVALEYALQQVIHRHAALRTQISTSSSGYQIQLHSPPSQILEIIDVAGYSPEQLTTKIDALYHQPFKLDTDLLIRSYLLKTGHDQYILLWIFHHIACDGWSIKIFNSEVSEFYNSYVENRIPNLNKLAVQFFDYVAWQRQQAANNAKRQLPYWREMLHGLPIQEMPLDTPRSIRNHSGNFLSVKIDATTTSKLLEIAKQNNTTSFAVLLTIYALQIAKLCKQQNIIILCPVSGRRHPDSEALIGCFVNIVVFRFKLDLTQDFVFNLKQNRETIYKALEYQDIPFNQLLKELQLSQTQLNSSLFQTMFALQNSNFDVVKLRNAKSSMQQIGYKAARLEYILELEQVGAEFVGGIYYNTGLFAISSVQKYADEYTSLCEYVVNDHAALADFWDINRNLSVLHTPINYSVPPYADMVNWFEDTASRFASNIAIKSVDGALTYAQLNQSANQLAHYLSLQGIEHNAIVAIRLPASNFSIISILAILKLGATYLPIDSSVPDEYFETIIEDSGCSFVICAAKPRIKIPYLLVNPLTTSMLHSMPSDNLPHVTRNIAYIIYTSGTTGKPKGVCIPHSNVLQLLASTQQEYKFNSNDVTLLFHSIAFDFSVWEIWLAFCYGGKLYIPTRSQIKSAEDVVDLVIKEKVTVLNQTPTAFKQFCLFYDACHKQPLSDLRLVVFGGEKLTPSDLLDFAKLNPQTKFYNMYGITETTVHTTFKHITRAEMVQESNIGIPLPGRTIYILGEKGNCLPNGEVGEIFVGGLGLAEGYHNLPERTQAVFLPDILDSNKRMYKTGDLACIVNGELVYHGRKDKQVQLRGFRIELAGIEATLNRHPNVKYSAVTVVDDQLVAYIAPNLNLVSPIFGKELPPDVFMLPNGIPIYQLNKNETEFLYEEIFTHNEYLVAGIRMRQAKCIVDIGANIGMFSVQARHVAPQAKIYAAEPIPDIFAVLDRNAKLYGPNIVPLNCGVAATSHSQTISFYPRMSIMSSVSDDPVSDQELIKTHIKAKLGDNYNLLDAAQIAELIDSYLEKREVTANFVTMDHIIQTNGISHIDLLKIDVEKHELDVVNGISDNNWQIIDQCVIEVQDQKGSLQKILEILKANGFYCKTRQYHTLQTSSLYVIYASKDAAFMQRETVETQPAALLHDSAALIDSLRAHVKAALPEYMTPSQYKVVDKFPMTTTGKIDFSLFKNIANEACLSRRTGGAEAGAPHFCAGKNGGDGPQRQDPKALDMPARSPLITVQHFNSLIQNITDTWAKLLGHSNIRPDDNFFDIGGNSLLTIQAYLSLKETLPASFRMLDFFNYPTARKLAEKILAEQPTFSVPSAPAQTTNAAANITVQEPGVAEHDIAVIGYAGIFPEAANIEQYWQNILKGKDCITKFTAEELLRLGVNPEYLRDPNFVKACGKIDNIDLFDHEFFGITPREAALMDPQHRIFLQLCWQALESASYTPEKTQHKIGIFAGMSVTNYLDAIYKHHGLKHCYGKDLILEITNHKDYLANRVAYKLDCTGASLNINTACSTSLVATVKACQSIVLGENDIALAGAISLVLPDQYGYFFQPDNVLSPDAVCRPFDNQANGIVIGSGGGVVVLKRLKSALRDGDNVRAVIRGYAVNNDGNQKIGFTAPALKGQVECISKAQQMAGVSPKDFSYLETHGTGTTLGDQIEIAALTQVFDQAANPYCALGSVKANIGHADCAAGIAGLLKVVLMMEHGYIPPATNFNLANQAIDWTNTPFYFPKQASTWQTPKQKIAGISSFGIGGTNAHLVVGNAPTAQASYCQQQRYLLVLSAQTQQALFQLKTDLLQLIQQPNATLADVAYSLQVGRKDYTYRAAWLVTAQNAVQELSKPSMNNLLLGPNDLMVQTARDWLHGKSVDWQFLHAECKHQRVVVPSHPLNARRCWFTDIKFTTQYNNAATTIDVLKAIAHKLLGVQTIQDSDDFFLMGGDSLAALTLIEELNQKLQVNLTLDDIFDAKTFAKIAQLIDCRQNKCEAKIKLLKHAASNHNMIIVHALGGSLYCYNEIVKSLENTNVYGISFENLTATGPSSIELLAAQYVELIASLKLNGSISLLGWSFGGSVSLEIARQLQQMGKKVAQVYMLDSWAKFDTFGAVNEDELRELFLKRIVQVHDTDWAKQWNDAIWLRSKMLLKYQPQNANIATTLFKANKLFPEFASMQDASNHWQNILGKNLNIISVDADHSNIVDPANSLTIAAICNNHILELENINDLVAI